MIKQITIITIITIITNNGWALAPTTQLSSLVDSAQDTFASTDSSKSNSLAAYGGGVGADQVPYNTQNTDISGYTSIEKPSYNEFAPEYEDLFDGVLGLKAKQDEKKEKKIYNQGIYNRGKTKKQIRKRRHANDFLRVDRYSKKHDLVKKDITGILPQGWMKPLTLAGLVTEVNNAKYDDITDRYKKYYWNNIFYKPSHIKRMMKELIDIDAQGYEYPYFTKKDIDYIIKFSGNGFIQFQKKRRPQNDYYDLSNFQKYSWTPVTAESKIGGFNYRIIDIEKRDEDVYRLYPWPLDYDSEEKARFINKATSWISDFFKLFNNVDIHPYVGGEERSFHTIKPGKLFYSIHKIHITSTIGSLAQVNFNPGSLSLSPHAFKSKEVFIHVMLHEMLRIFYNVNGGVEQPSEEELMKVELKILKDLEGFVEFAIDSGDPYIFDHMPLEFTLNDLSGAYERMYEDYKILQRTEELDMVKVIEAFKTDDPVVMDESIEGYIRVAREA